MPAGTKDLAAERAAPLAIPIEVPLLADQPMSFVGFDES
jgi:hypothetical protein